MTPQALAAFATLVSFAQNGNRVELKLDRGSAELVWISPGAFHFRRTLEGALADAGPERSSDAVPFKLEDTPSALHLRSKMLDVALAKRGLLVKVLGPDSTVLLEDSSEPKSDGMRVSWERQAPAGVRFYGLGPLDSSEMDVRGKTVDSLMPLLVSTAGFGEQHARPGRFDFTAPGSYRVESPQVDYYFLYGPKPKQIFEQMISTGTLLPWHGAPQQAAWNALRSRLQNAAHEAMSGPFVPPFDFTNSAKAPGELQARIRQIAALVPNAPDSFAMFSPFRKQLASFFDVYAIETRDKHYPLWHALPFQFPDDPECAHHADEFMLGDEMLVAPIYQPGNRRAVYFPPGTWTDLDTDRQYPGRSTAVIETEDLPVFAHTGAIVPLDSSDAGIALHYFPNLPGEFFFLEKDLGAYSQVHAAPADDVLRLEIESRKERVYRWVIHHVERPAAVTFDNRPYPSTYDAAQRNVAIEVRVKAGEDNVIHLSW